MPGPMKEGVLYIAASSDVKDKSAAYAAVLSIMKGKRKSSTWFVKSGKAEDEQDPCSTQRAVLIGVNNILRRLNSRPHKLKVYLQSSLPKRSEKHPDLLRRVQELGEIHQLEFIKISELEKDSPQATFWRKVLNLASWGRKSQLNINP